MAVGNNQKQITSQPSNVIPGVVIFLAINLLVAAMYHGVLNP